MFFPIDWNVLTVLLHTDISRDAQRPARQLQGASLSMRLCCAVPCFMRCLFRVLLFILSMVDVLYVDGTAVIYLRFVHLLFFGFLPLHFSLFSSHSFVT